MYALVIDLATIRLGVAILVQPGGKMRQIDIRPTFLNGKLDNHEKLHLNPPEGVEFKLNQNGVMKLLKVL